MLIGKKIKEIRKQKKISLTELSKRSGVQIATLSRIESQKMVGTINSHMNIAHALGLDVTDLYQSLKPSKEIPDVSTAPSPQEAFTYNKNASYEMLTANVLSKRMMPVLLRVEPHGQTNPEQLPLGSERFLFILEGEITAHVGNKTFHLTSTNTLYFDASQKHYFENTGAILARAISVLTPVTL